MHIITIAPHLFIFSVSATLVGQIVLWAGVAIGLLMLPFNLPGTFIMVGAAFLHALITHFHPFSPTVLLILLGLAILAELIEYVIGTFITAKFGASKWGILGAIAGGILGAVAGTPVMPVIGTVIGGFAGAFLGASVLEYIHFKKKNEAIQAGFGALMGKLGGTLAKLIVAMAMIMIMIRQL